MSYFWFNLHKVLFTTFFCWRQLCKNTRDTCKSLGKLSKHVKVEKLIMQKNKIERLGAYYRVLKNQLTFWRERWSKVFINIHCANFHLTLENPPVDFFKSSKFARYLIICPQNQLVQWPNIFGFGPCFPKLLSSLWISSVKLMCYNLDFRKY